MKKTLSMILAVCTIISATLLFTGCKDEEGSKGNASEASEVVSETVSKAESEATSETSEEASEVVSEEASEAVSEDASEVVSEDASEETSEVAPEGYAIYNDGAVSYFYPDTWTLSENIVMDAAGNNVNVVSEPLTTMYKTMTIDSFNETLAPAFVSMGMEVSDVVVDHKTNANGVEVDIISFKNTYMEITMAQTLYAVSSESKTHCVTVTEVVVTEGLTDVVFDSLKVVG